MSFVDIMQEPIYHTSLTGILLPIQEKPIPEGRFRGKSAAGRAHGIIHRGDETDDPAVFHDLHFGPRLDAEFLPEPGGDDDLPFRQRPDGSQDIPTYPLICLTLSKWYYVCPYSSTLPSLSPYPRIGHSN
jgi:hypothetical protein